WSPTDSLTAMGRKPGSPCRETLPRMSTAESIRAIRPLPTPTRKEDEYVFQVFQLEFATTVMLGVISDPTEESAVREFFELFKIPWEFYRNQRQYQVVLCTGDAKPEPSSTRLLILYASEETEFDVRLKIETRLYDHETNLSLSAGSLPLYGSHATFLHRGTKVLSSEDPGKTVGFVDRLEHRLFASVGYDLFREVQCLLTRGQPPANAGTPTLELHIAFLRDLIVGCGIPLVEIPPLP